MGGQARWVPHLLNPIDRLTKQKGNTQCLLQFLKKTNFPQKKLWEKSERKEKLSLYFATLTSFSYLNQMNVDKAKERFASSISTFFQCLVNSVARKLWNTSDLEL